MSVDEDKAKNQTAEPVISLFAGSLVMQTQTDTSLNYVRRRRQGKNQTAEPVISLFAGSLTMQTARFWLGLAALAKLAISVSGEDRCLGGQKKFHSNGGTGLQ